MASDAFCAKASLSSNGEPDSRPAFINHSAMAEYVSRSHSSVLIIVASAGRGLHNGPPSACSATRSIGSAAR
jgi:hypothetical protein